MKKILPVNFDIPHFTRGWEAVRFPVIFVDHNNYSWFLDKCNELWMNNFETSYYYKYYSTERLNIYDDIIDYTRINSFNSSNIVDIVKENINNGKYIIIVLDHFYISRSNFHGKSNHMLDIMVYGYDDSDNSFITIDLNINDLSQGYTKIAYSELVAGFLSATEMMSKGESSYFFIQHVPVSSFSLKKGPFAPNLINFYIQMKNNLNGETFISESTASVLRHGVSVYKGYYEALPEYLASNGIKELHDKPLLLWGVKTLFIIKSSLSDKLSFINNRYGRIDEQIIHKNNELSFMLRDCFYLLTKYSYSEKEAYLDEFIKKFKQIEDTDKKILNEIINCLYPIISHEYGVS